MTELDDLHVRLAVAALWERVRALMAHRSCRGVLVGTKSDGRHVALAYGDDPFEARSLAEASVLIQSQCVSVLGHWSQRRPVVDATANAQALAGEVAHRKPRDMSKVQFAINLMDDHGLSQYAASKIAKVSAAAVSRARKARVSSHACTKCGQIMAQGAEQRKVLRPRVYEQLLDEAALADPRLGDQGQEN